MLIGCQPVVDKSDAGTDKVRKVHDLTKTRFFDSTYFDNPDSLRFAESQRGYNKHKTRRFKQMLNELELEPLNTLQVDSNGMRLIAYFSWGTQWSGDPLALALYSDNKTTRAVSSESTFDKFHTGNDDELLLLKRLYRVDTSRFGHLQNQLDSLNFWNEFSFHENRGWTSCDANEFFIEAKIDTAYKVLMLEDGERLMTKYLVEFLRATNYNDTIRIDMEHYLNSTYK